MEGNQAGLSGPRSDFPTGWTPVWVDGVEHEANFVKVAVNVMRRPGSDDNVLAGILRGWFGERAGAPGMTSPGFDTIKALFCPIFRACSTAGLTSSG